MRKMRRMMALFHRWHIWLGWLVAVPLLFWTATGLLMVSRPIDEVRGTHLRVDQPERPLGEDATYSIALSPEDGDVASISIAMDGDEAITTLTRLDGSITRYGPDGRELPTLNEVGARTVVARQIVGGEDVRAARYFDAENVPFDFRRPMPVWQVALNDGTHVYVGAQTGQIEAVRTPFWRAFDFAWGLHIMDLSEREDTSHPLLIIFTALSLVGVVLGTVLMFRRRRAKPRSRPAPNLVGDG